MRPTANPVCCVALPSSAASSHLGFDSIIAHENSGCSPAAIAVGRKRMQAQAPSLLVNSISSSATYCFRRHRFLFNRSQPSSFLLPQFHLQTMTTTTSAPAVRGSSAEKGGESFTTLSEIVTLEREIKKSKFIAIASHVSSEESALSFLSHVRHPRATHNCWAFKIGDQFRTNDDGEPSGTAGKPIYSAIDFSGLDRVMVVVIRYFGGIKLGTGGLVRAYGGVASECLRNAPTCLVKSKIPMGVEVSFDLIGPLYHQLQTLQAEDIKQDYETGKDGTTIVTFKVDFDRAQSLENTIRATCGHDIVFYNQ